MSLMRPDDAQATVAQLGEVAGAEPVVVERGGVVVADRRSRGTGARRRCSTPPGRACEPMRTSTPPSGRPSSASRTASGSSRAPAVLIGASDEPYGPQHDDAVLVLGAGEDARVEHRAAEVHGRDRYVGDAPRSTPRRARGRAGGRDRRRTCRPSPRGSRTWRRRRSATRSSAARRASGATVIACIIPVTDASGLITKRLSAAVRPAASM